MSLVDAITFMAALLFLLISGRHTAKRKKEVPVEAEAETAFEQRELRRVKELQEWIHGKTAEATPLPVDRASQQRARRQAAERHGSARIVEKMEPAEQHAGYTYPIAPVQAQVHASAGGDFFAHPQEELAASCNKKSQSSRASHLLRNLKSPQEMVLLHEIFSAPKGLSVGL